MMKLYHWEPSGNSLKVMICLAEMGQAYKSHYVDILEFEQYAEEFLALNAAGQVPVLVHDGSAISESSEITQYLAEVFPAARLAPTDARGWYELLAWCKYLDAYLGTSVATLGWHQVMAPVMKQRDQKKLNAAVERIPIAERKAAWIAATRETTSEEQLENSRRKVDLAVRRMEEALAKSPWLTGADFSIVDINAYALARTLPQLLPKQVSAGKTPKVMDWLGRMGDRPAVKKSLAQRGKQGEKAVYAPGPEHSRWG